MTHVRQHPLLRRQLLHHLYECASDGLKINAVISARSDDRRICKCRLPSRLQRTGQICDLDGVASNHACSRAAQSVVDGSRTRIGGGTERA